jgi:signal transduction histidine kinase
MPAPPGLHLRFPIHRADVSRRPEQAPEPAHGAVLVSGAVSDDDLTLLTRRYAQLLSLAVHEFRTPASVVGGYLRMLQRDTESPLADRHRKMVEEAEKSCARMIALVGELSEVSKLDDPQTKLQEEPLDLFAMMQEVAGEMRETPETADRGVRVEARGAASGGTLTGDVVRLHRSLNAFVRAVLREQPDGQLVVADCRVTDNRGRSALIIIAPEDRIEWAAHATPMPLDEKRGGLGLAVPIARRVVTRHGGHVWSPPSEKGDSGTKGAIVVSIPIAGS